MCTLRPTRLIVCSDALAAFMANYTELMELWDLSLWATSDIEMRVQLRENVDQKETRIWTLFTQWRC